MDIQQNIYIKYIKLIIIFISLLFYNIYIPSWYYHILKNNNTIYI